MSQPAPKGRVIPCSTGVSFCEQTMQTSKNSKVKPGPSLTGFTKHEPDTRSTTPPLPPLVPHPKPKQFTLKLPKLRPPSFRKSVQAEAPVHSSLQASPPESEKCVGQTQQQPQPAQEPEPEKQEQQQKQQGRQQQQPEAKMARHLSDSRQRILELECRMDKLESDLDFTAEVTHKTLVRASLLQVATSAMLRDMDSTEPSAQP